MKGRKIMVSERKKDYRIIILLSIILTGFSGCFGKQDSIESNERIYATVNNSHLTESELRDIVPKEYFDKLTSEHKNEIVKEWVNNELLYQEALRLGIDKEPEISRILKNSESNLLSAEIFERRLSEVSLPDEEELRKYYDEHKDYFILQSNEYRVRYAVFDNMKDARNFWGKVKKGESFSTLAKEHSQDQSAKSGGELGIVNEESVETAVWNAIINTVENRGMKKISDSFSVIDGFGIVIIDEMLEKGTVKPFDDIREQVLDYCMIEKREEIRQSFLMKLAREAQIEYNF